MGVLESCMRYCHALPVIVQTCITGQEIIRGTGIIAGLSGVGVFCDIWGTSSILDDPTLLQGADKTGKFFMHEYS